MKINLTLRLSFLILFFACLNACGKATPAPVVTTTPTVKLPTTTPTLPLPTQTSTPLVNQQMIDSWLTQIAIATPIRTPVSQAHTNKSGVYGNESGLYFQSENGELTQLTRNKQDNGAILSDDGQVIVFYRGGENDAVYAVNANGSNERLIIESKSLPTLGQGEITALTFKPNSHYLLFNTYLCNPTKNRPSYNATDCTVSVYVMDVDRSEIVGFLSGLSGNTMQNRNFEISPDGMFVSVANSGHIDIYANNLADSNMVYQNAITYWRTRPDEYLPRQYWLPDSSGLIAIVAEEGQTNGPADPAALYVAYRYILGDTMSKIPFDKTLTGDFMREPPSCVSPDRNWILFAGIDSDNLQGEVLHYLGNLNNGKTQAFEEFGMPLDCQWSLDSKHFVSSMHNFIGSVDGSLPIPIGGYFLGWIDNTHYYYGTYENGKVESSKIYIGEITDK